MFFFVQKQSKSKFPPSAPPSPRAVERYLERHLWEGMRVDLGNAELQVLCQRGVGRGGGRRGRGWAAPKGWVGVSSKLAGGGDPNRGGGAVGWLGLGST